VVFQPARYFLALGAGSLVVGGNADIGGDAIGRVLSSC
jgi:hypothetical protein